MKNMRVSIKQFVTDNINEFVIEEYQSKWQNDVMTMGISALTETMNDNNREAELLLLADIFKKDFASFLIENPKSRLWVVRNVDNIYGYIFVTIKDDIAKIIGFYLDHILRNTGMANKLIDTVKEYCECLICKYITFEVADYSLAMIKFCEKNNFKCVKTTLENKGKLLINHYEIFTTANSNTFHLTP